MLAPYPRDVTKPPHAPPSNFKPWATTQAKINLSYGTPPGFLKILNEALLLRCGEGMGAVDTKVLVRLLVANDPAQTNGLLPS